MSLFVAESDPYMGAQLEESAISVSVQALVEITTLACACKMKGPSGRWKVFREGLDAIRSFDPKQPEVLHRPPCGAPSGAELEKKDSCTVKGRLVDNSKETCMLSNGAVFEGSGSQDQATKL